MKKVLLLLAVFCITFSVGAQSKEQALKALDKAKSVTEHEKKSKSPTTWIKLADAYMNAYSGPREGIVIGLSSMETKLLLRAQKVLSSEVKSISGEDFTVDTYDNKILYYGASGQLEAVSVTKPYLDEDMLEQSYNALMKAHELDAKGSKKAEIAQRLIQLKNNYIDEAMSANKMGDVKAANQYFEASLKTVENEIVNQIDTLITYYTGLTFNMLEDYDNAKKYLQKCIDLEYYQDGDVISRLAEIFKIKGELEESKKLLAFGIEQFPSSQAILVSLINIYSETNDDPNKILEYIRTGQKNEPTNASLHYAEGNIHKKLGDMDAAIVSYYKSSEIDPTYFYGIYTAGTTYFDKAIEIQEQMTELDINDVEGYDELGLEFEKYLIMAIEPFEKAFEMAIGDLDFQLAINEGLKQIYFRFRDKSPEYKAGFERCEKFLEENGTAPVAE